MEAQAGFLSPGLCEHCSWSLLHAALLMASLMPVWHLFFRRWLLFVLFSGDAFGNHLLSLMFCNFNRMCLGFPHSFFLALLSLFNLEAVSSTVGRVPPWGCISSSPCVLAVLPLGIPHSRGCTPGWVTYAGFFSLILSTSSTFCSKSEGFLNLTFKPLCLILNINNTFDTYDFLRVSFIIAPFHSLLPLLYGCNIFLMSEYI